MKHKILVAVLISASLLSAAWNVSPAGWDDIKFGLVNDNSDYSNRRIKHAVVDRDIAIDYRYVYLNGGVNPANNRLSWSYTEYQNYTLDSEEDVGCPAAYVVYMLQEEGGVETLKSTAADSQKMKQFFESIRIVAEYAKGDQSTWVIEPDTWGYVLQNNQSDTGSAFLENIAHINNLGYSHLSGFDNKISNLAQAIITHIKHYAPDAYAGVLMSFWSVDANKYVDEQFRVSDAVGFAEWHMEAVEYSARVNLAFAEKLLSRDDYSKGDFIGIEKNGYDAGWWKVNSDKGDYYYWSDQQMRKWLRWSEILGKGLDLPLLGWQISIGHEGLPNLGSANSSNEIGNGQYEDTFFPFFFEYPEEFIDIGFIGFLVGKGLADGTDFTNSTDPLDDGKGDLGWFMNQLAEFDRSRPWLPAGKKRYKVTAAVEGSGTVSPSGLVRVDSSQNQTFTFTANEWTVIDSVLIDGTNVGTAESYQLTDVSKDQTIKVYFGDDPSAPDYYTITASVDGNGSISPTGSIKVYESSDTTINITPNQGYIIDHVTYDGEDLGPVQSFTFDTTFARFSEGMSIPIEAFFSPKIFKSTYEEWTPSKVYATAGTEVTHKGKVYISKQWTQGNDPETEAAKEWGNKWELVGDDTSGGDDTLTVIDVTYFVNDGKLQRTEETHTTINSEVSTKIETIGLNELSVT